MAYTQDASGSASTPGTFAREIRKEGFAEIYIGLERPQLDVVVAHGLQGHPVKTWTYESNTPDHASVTSKIFLGFPRKPKQNSASAPEPTSGVQKTGRFENETHWPRDLLPGNHIDMCRFEGPDDEGYRQFKGELKRHITRVGGNKAQELESM